MSGWADAVVNRTARQTALTPQRVFGWEFVGKAKEPRAF